MANKLRTRLEISEVNEQLFDDMRQGKIDTKTLDGCNTILKSQVYLNVKLPLDYLKIYVAAQVKKINLPVGLLPDVDAIVKANNEAQETK